VRAAEDNVRLWQGLKDGTIQALATDHCPFFFAGDQPIVYEGQPVAIPGKELGQGNFTKIPNGLPGVGDRLPVLWTYGVRAERSPLSSSWPLPAPSRRKSSGCTRAKERCCPARMRISLSGIPSAA